MRPRVPVLPILAVLRSPLWVATALLVAAATFAFGVWLPNLGLIFDVTTDGGTPVPDRLRFLWSSLGAATTAISPAQAVLLGAVAILFGLNLALALRTMVQRSRQRVASGAGSPGS